VRSASEAQPSQGPEGPTPIEPYEGDTQPSVWCKWCKEAEAVRSAGEAQPSQGRLRARREAKARRARPSAWPEPDAQKQLQPRAKQGGRTQGPTPIEPYEGDTQPSMWCKWCKEAEAVRSAGEAQPSHSQRRG
jgi:hypothetical protein